MTSHNQIKRRFEAGRPETFAIRASFDEWVGKYCLGQFVYFVGSREFGRWNYSVDLATSFRYTTKYAKNRGVTPCFDVAALPTRELIWWLHGRFMADQFPPDVDPSASVPAEWEGWPWYQCRNRFGLVLTGDASLIDAASIVAVKQCDGTERVVAYDYEADEVADVTLPSREFESILWDYLDWVDSLSAARSDADD